MLLRPGHGGGGGPGQSQHKVGADLVKFAQPPQVPYKDYDDEVIYFSDDPSVVNSFRTKFDDLWINTTDYGNHANVTMTFFPGYNTSSSKWFQGDPWLDFDFVHSGHSIRDNYNLITAQCQTRIRANAQC